MEILEPQELSNGFTELVQLEYGHVPNQVRLDLSQSVGFAAASNTVSGTARIVIAGGTLSANVDLRGLGKVTLDGDIDLNGCVVRVAALDGAGMVTSTFSDSAAFDLTTTQTDDTYVKSYFGDNTEPQAFSGQPAWKAFADYAAYNYGEQRVIDTSANFPKHIVYDFQTPTFIDTYKIMLGTSANTAPKRAPKTIAFAGSNDGITWTPLDSRPSETGWSASQERTYSFANERAYRYYRISFSANNGDGTIIEFFRLQYGRQKKNALLLDMAGLDASDLSNISTSGSGRVSVGDVVLSDDLQWNTGWKSKLSIDGTIDLHGNELTVGKLEGAGTITDTLSSPDKTDSDATRVWSPNTYFSSNAGTAKDAFSNPFVTSTPSSTKTRVMAEESQLPVVIDYDFRTATVVDSYRLTVGDNVNRAPGAWELFGSNDDAAYMSGELTAWTRLDTHFGETWSAPRSSAHRRAGRACRLQQDRFAHREPSPCKGRGRHLCRHEAGPDVQRRHGCRRGQADAWRARRHDAARCARRRHHRPQEYACRSEWQLCFPQLRFHAGRRHVDVQRKRCQFRFDDHTNEAYR